MPMHDEKRTAGDNVARQQRWDERYRNAAGLPPASELLRAWIGSFTPGRALDLACGSGRNALLLAGHGWRVLGVDYAPHALRLARREARRRRLALELVAADLDRWPLPVARFDLVCVFRFLDRALCPSIAAAVRPGGILIYETFTVDQRRFPGGPREDAYLLEPGELARLFPQFEPLHSFEGVRDDAGSPRAVAELVACRTGRQL